MATFSELIEETRLAARALVEYGGSLFNPTIRLGITGLSRAGKTVFITALVHGLVRGGRFPVFEAQNEGRIVDAHLAPQPDDAVPRFDYENHLHALLADRVWPQSTRQISELRLVIEYQSRSGSMRELTLDIVDYPGEWLLDLPLLDKSYETWSQESLALSRSAPRAPLAKAWHEDLAGLDPTARADEPAAITAARLFTEYLLACRNEQYAMSLLPPGRFLMPGDLAGSPALTFSPLDLPADTTAPDGSLWAMMRRRYEAYKDVLVRPFFREHFARLDRQIVLVDALAAFNAGPEAVHDLEGALKSILDCFEVGRRTFFTSLLWPRADRILFAATKADHLHPVSHDRLEAILRRMVDRAIDRGRPRRRRGRRDRARRGPRDQGGAGPAWRRDAAGNRRGPGGGRDARRPEVRRGDRGGGVSRRPTGRSRRRLRAGQGRVPRARERHRRRDRLPLPALPPAAARARG